MVISNNIQLVADLWSRKSGLRQAKAIIQHKCQTQDWCYTSGRQKPISFEFEEFWISWLWRVLNWSYITDMAAYLKFEYLHTWIFETHIADINLIKIFFSGYIGRGKQIKSLFSIKHKNYDTKTRMYSYSSL